MDTKATMQIYTEDTKDLKKSRFINFETYFNDLKDAKEWSEEGLEMCKLIISIASIVVTSIFSLVTIIITCNNVNKQIKESEKAFMLQKEQYEKENLHNKEIERIQKRPYLVIDKSSNCILQFFKVARRHIVAVAMDPLTVL